MTHEEEMAVQYQEGYKDGFKEAKKAFCRPKGHWITEEGVTLPYVCSECGSFHNGKHRNFCPECGADMRGAK